ncbi:MAG TPA: helix-turn-helix transcriptional regulator [Pelomicrobium sp.]|nr:helix-turn-helix transcriptional regulator [Pelomicrobium sp.]
MTRPTQPAYYMRVPRPVAAMAKDFPDGHRIPRDRHPRGQLIYAIAGVMSVTTPHGTWVVPPQRAVWVPPGTDHESRMHGDVAMRTLYVRADAARAMPQRCCVVNVSPLMRELIVEATRVPLRYDERGRDGRLMRLLLDELAGSPALPLHLPQPADKRLKRICDALLRDPANAEPLSRWAGRVGASPRTLARLFQAETGMPFTIWRQQARLLAALARLAAGEPVTAVALNLGYASPSAFTAMFRRALGAAPRDYFR